MSNLLALIVGYLLGSLSPAYFLGRWLKGIDIREHGRKYAGTVNTYKVLGSGPAVITAFYDVFKGILALLIAFYCFKTSLLVAYLAGFSAVLGHIFPFYLQFRGGFGVATSTGLLISLIALFLKRGWLFLPQLIFLGLLVLSLYVLFKKGALVGAFTLPCLYYFMIRQAPSLEYLLPLTLILVHIWAINLWDIKRYRLLKLKPQTKQALLHLRVLLRPAALAFPLLYLYLSQKTLLILIGSVALFFLVLDLNRLFFPKLNLFLLQKAKFFFRQKEKKTLSSATTFLGGVFLTIYLFDKAVATQAILFLIIGDLAAKFAGLEHGQWKIFQRRTLRGSLAYFLSCLVVGYLWSLVLPLPLFTIALGALGASLAELLSLGIDDNLTVPLVSATLMTLVHFF